MCAIFGIIGRSDPGLLKKMSKCQLYRGPDKQNFLVNKKFKLSLGMNRLAVIDKRKGNQPMLSHDGRHVIVFNGTIYNFKDLKKYLENKITFKTSSDTEVLINSYNYWGKKCFNYFDGMWAVAIFDFKTKTTTLSRDYLGQKPLFYSQNRDHLIFSSQINGIFQINKNFTFSKKNALEYFRFNHYPAPLTGYNNLFQVSPGELIEFRDKKIFKKRYWDVQKGGNYNIFFKKNNIKSASNLFLNIIKNFSIADEKVGLCLSSGIDSQLIKINLEKVLKKIKSFTIGFKDKTYDESRFIKSSKKNKNYKSILSKKDYKLILNNIKKEIYFPFGDASIIPTYKVFKLARKQTNVTLTGDGGDELFFGYLAFKGFYLLEKIKLICPKFLLNIFKFFFGNLKASENYMDNKKKISYFFKYIDKKNYEALLLWISSFDNFEEKKYFRNKNFVKSKFLGYIEKIYRGYEDKMKFSQIFFLKFYLPVILIKSDFSSMLNSMESRAPYLSKDLVNYSLDLPAKKNFSLLKQRPLMKKIFEKEFTEIDERKKHGFAFNKREILKNKNYIYKILKKKFIINFEYFEKNYKSYLSGNLSNEQYLWNELMLNFSRQNLEK
tara:strand:+ start:2118 stop:3938 length:1821 start_codon:yes stop_codon:yes gene_type:complete